MYSIYRPNLYLYTDFLSCKGNKKKSLYTRVATVTYMSRVNYTRAAAVTCKSTYLEKSHNLMSCLETYLNVFMHC